MDDLLAYSKYELVLCMSKLNNTALQVLLQRVYLILIFIVSFWRVWTAKYSKELQQSDWIGSTSDCKKK